MIRNKYKQLFSFQLILGVKIPRNSQEKSYSFKFLNKIMRIFDQIHSMNQSFFRGGGLICSYQHIEVRQNEDELIIEQEQIQEFFLDLDSKCSNLNDLSKSIQLQESQDNIIKIIRSILFQSQYINQASRNTGLTRQYIKQILNNLETLLDCITNIVSQRHITLQILKIGNQISRLIFQYYPNDQSIPLDQEKQQSILSLINQIEGLFSQGGEQLYYNSIYYELFIIKICIEICPTNSEEGQEVLLNIISGVKASLSEMSVDLLISLAQGGQYLYKEIKKRKQRNIFKIIFYLEEFKYKIIEKIQQGQGINKIIKQLTNNYNTLIKESNEWLIRCSWIKIIGELIIYQPIITYKQFQITKLKFQLQTEWDYLLQKRIVKIIDDKRKIAIIQQNNETSQTNRILQQQILKFQVLQNCIIKGEKNMPKLEQLKEFSDHIQNVDNQQNNAFIEQFQNVPISQFIQQLTEYQKKIIKFVELVQDFIEEIEHKNNNKQYLLTQIEFIISESDELCISWYQLSLHNEIIYDVLNAVSNQIFNDQQGHIQINLLINSTISYFTIAEFLEYKFDNLISEYQQITTKLMDQYNCDMQTEKIKLIQDDKVGKLISKLQEMEKNSKIIIRSKDLIDYIKMIPIITHQIQQDRAILITHNLAFFNIRCILEFSNPLDQTYFTYIKDQIPKNQFFQHIFLHYSAIQTLFIIYEQINDNQDILIKNILNNQDLRAQIGINLQTFQLNHRIQELINNQIVALSKLQEQSNQERTLYQKIQYLNLIEYVYEDMLKQLKILTYDIGQQIERVEELDKSKKLENPQSQIEDQINENFNLICIDDSKFIELITKRLRLYSQLEKDQQQHLNIDDMQLFQLIIEDDQQQYLNISKLDIIKVIKEQNTKFNKKAQKENNNESVIMIYQSYLINMNNIIKDIDMYKNQQKSSLLIQNMNNITNFIKLQIFQGKQLEQLKCIQYNQIVEEFQQIFFVDVDRVQDNLNLQLSILQKQEQKLSLNESIYIIPSFKQLQDRALDNSKKQSIKQKAFQFINDQFTNEFWRVKDYLYSNCLEFYKHLNENNQTIVGQFLLIARFKEIDYRIINTLKGKDQIQQMDLLIHNQWEDTEDKVNNELLLRLNELQVIQLSLQSEERKDIRDELLQKHQNIEQQLEQEMKNVKEIGDVLGVTVYFLKDIQKDLAMIQNKLENIINSIDLIGQDIKFLRGKTPQQLLEIRMQSVLQNKIYQDAQSVYVQMKTQEFDFNTNQEKQEQTPLFNIDNFQNGEIDEFLKENKKSSLLIHGVAGSGKSLTARKIEEYLWKEYQKQCENKLWSEIKCTTPQVPIFIQLPTLKQPKFNSIEETLLQLYRFDQKQIDLLKEIAQQNQIRLIFIMDSYDELPQQYQGINLVQSNKIYLWKPQNQLQISKVITTSRSEAFTTNDYRAWFWENDTLGFQSLKEIRLLPFDFIQRQDFLKQFSILKLKISIYDLLSIIARNLDKNTIFQDTNDIYQQFEQQQLNIKQEKQQNFLVDKNNLQNLIIIIRDNKNVALFNQEQETSFSKLILGLWHQNLYNDSILQMNLQSLLETPYMLNIVVEVLPQMNNQVSQPNGIKQHFIKNYIYLTKRFLDSTINIIDLNQVIMNDKVQKYKYYMDGPELIQDAYKLWELLLECQFFNNWNIQSNYEHSVAQLQKTQIINEQFPFKISDEEHMIIIYRSLKSHKLCLFDFFNLFIEQFVENQRSKQIYSNDIIDQNQFEQDIYKYAKMLSILMFQRQETVIERKPQGILFREQINDPYQQFFEDADQYGIYRKQIRKCIPLSQKGNFYQFRHKSIQEFLLSKASFELFENIYQVIDLLNELLGKLRKDNKQLHITQLQQEYDLNKQNLSTEEQRKQDQLVQILKTIETSFLNHINLQDTFNLGALKFIKTNFSHETDLCKVLYPLVLLSSVQQEYTKFSSNCLIILLSVSQFQSRQDFQRIIISEISIDGAIFENCDLRYSKFDKVSIKGLNLNFSDVSYCEWTNLYSNDLPAIQSDGSNSFSQLSPNGQLILQYSLHSQTRNTILIWDSNSGDQVVQLKGHTEVIYAIFSHNGKLILSYGQDQFIRLWDVQTFTQIKEQKLEFYIVGMIFSEQDDKIACYNYNDIYVISNLEKMNEGVTINIKKICYAFRFNEQFLITLRNEKDQFYMQQWNYDTNQLIQEQCQEIPKLLEPSFGCFHRDLLFVAYNDNTIRKWDIIKFQQQGNPFKGHVLYINCLDVSLDGKYLISAGGDSLIIIHDIKSCNKLSTLIGHQGVINSVQFSHDLKLIITCSYDGQIRFWDAKVNKQQEISSFVKTVMFTPDSNQLIHLNNRGQIIYNETETGQQIDDKISEDTNLISSMCLHPNGKYLLYTTGLITKIIDLRLIKQVGSSKQTEEKVLNVGYSSGGNKVFLAFDWNIVIFDPVNWSKLQNHEYVCKLTQLSSNYKYIIHIKRYEFQVQPRSYEIFLIDFNTQLQQRLQINMDIEQFDLSNDSKILVAIPTEIRLKIIIIWDMTYKQSEPQKVKINIESEIIAMKISPNCRYVFVGSENGNISTIDLQKKYLVNLIVQSQRRVRNIMISPNQRYLTAITDDPILYVSQIEEKDCQISSFTKYSIPQKLCFQTLIQNTRFENSIIKSHLGYDLRTIFQRKIETQRKQKK